MGDLKMDVRGRRQVWGEVGLSWAVLPSATVLLLAIFCASCRTIQSEATRTAPAKPTRVSQEELRGRLNEFGEYFVNRIRIAAGEIDRRDPSSRAKQLTLVYRVRFSKDLYTMLEQSDPIKACIDAWALCVRIDQYFEERKGQGLLEATSQQIAIDAMKEVLAEVERIVRLFLDEETFGTAEREVVAFARQNPIQSPYRVATVYASRAKQGGANPLEDIINIPLAPLKAVQGVDSGAVAIHSFNDTAARFADIVELLPEAMHWQVLLWLYEFEDTELAQGIMGNIATVSESSSQLAETLEQYPRRVREETAALFDELDEKQENLQTTLTTLDSVIGSLDEAATSVTATAQAWESVVKTAGHFVKEVSPLKPAGEVVVEKEPGRPFDIKDYQATAEALTSTAGELRMLTKELQDLVELGTLKDAVGTAAASAGQLVDRIAWRLGMLVMLIFVLAFVLVITGRVVVPRRA